jgi:hypothetical protein
LWSEAVQSDCEFRTQIDRFEMVGPVWFSIEAFQIVGKIGERVRTLIVPIDSELGESVALMARMGFFVLTGERYQMVLPRCLDGEMVKGAGLAVWPWQPRKMTSMTFILSGCFG